MLAQTLEILRLTFDHHHDFAGSLKNRKMMSGYFFQKEKGRVCLRFINSVICRG